ncbi:MAG: hypothetical protein EZS28_055717 [Streblomastix strix]|uniref:Uncharacterized protein n=1 Tax=Streblomastix strix TaxID=222440 RepID=A0A5J4PYG4_9EUKA|nr:MAG: hypothetical protein EZS28_055717 [Streblomastix strix]
MRGYQSLCFQLPNSQAFHPLSIIALYFMLFVIYGFDIDSQLYSPEISFHYEVSGLLIVFQVPNPVVRQLYSPRSQEHLEVCWIISLSSVSTTGGNSILEGLIWGAATATER